MDTLAIIYKIKNIVSNKCYIGSSVDGKKRWVGHKRDLKLEKHHNQHLQRAWNKYGSENFSFEILENVLDKSKLIEREQYYLDVLQPEYNIQKIAGNSYLISKKHSGLNHSNETKEKIKQSMMKNTNTLGKTWHLSIDTCERMSKAKKGKKHPLFGKSSWNKGIPRSIWSKGKKC